MELCDLSAHQIVHLIHQRQISALEVCESALKRIAAVDGRPGVLEPGALTGEDQQRVHAFISLAEARARTQAAAIDHFRRSAREHMR